MGLGTFVWAEDIYFLRAKCFLINLVEIWFFTTYLVILCSRFNKMKQREVSRRRFVVNTICVLLSLIFFLRFYILGLFDVNGLFSLIFVWSSQIFDGTILLLLQPLLISFSPFPFFFLLNAPKILRRGIFSFGFEILLFAS